MEEEEEGRPAGGENTSYERPGKGRSGFQGIDGKKATEEESCAETSFVFRGSQKYLNASAGTRKR